MNLDIVIYHANCLDGFTAAWVVRQLFPTAQYLPAKHGDAPPLECAAGKRVLLVDFAYPREATLDLAAAAESLLVLDHHKTAEADLQELPGAGTCWAEYVSAVGAGMLWQDVGVLFDMERSGARLAWDFFHPGEEVLPLVQIVEDRDLWRFKLPHTRAITAALLSYRQTWTTWDTLSEALLDTAGRDKLFAEGAALERKHEQDMRQLVTETSRVMVIAGRPVPVANIPWMFASTAGDVMSEGEAFSATYFDTAAHRVFSLRSRGDMGADVAEIARRYGGGGHRNAAGFRMPIGWEGDAPTA
jgi:hypothetical protein